MPRHLRKAKTRAEDSILIEIVESTRTVVVKILPKTGSEVVTREFDPFEAEMLGIHLIEAARKCMGREL